MATKVNFQETAANTSGKRQFTTTLFHDSDIWQILPYDASKNGAIASDADAGTESSPILRVQRVVNGALVGNIEKLFISSLYRADESVLGVEIPKSGELNKLVRKIWDDAAYQSDAAALEAIIEQAKSIHSDLRFTVSRKPVKISANADAVHQVLRFGKQVPLQQMNWN